MMNRRRKRLAGIVLTSALVLCLSDPTAAQQPTSPPEEPLAGETPLVAPTAGWDFGATLGASWDGNVAFLTPDSKGDVQSFLGMGLGYNRRSPRGQIRFSLNGSGTFYATLTDFNRADGAAAITGSYRLSRRVTLGLGGDFAYSHTDTLPALIQGGLQFPLTRSQSFGGSAGLTWQLAERTSLSLSLRYGQIDFPDEGFVDTRSANAGLSLSRRLGKRDSLSLNYGFQRTGQSPDFSDSHFAAAGWGHTLPAGLSLSLSGGTSFYVGSGSPSEGQWFFYGSAGLAGRVRRATLSFQFSHSVTPAYGLGGDTLSDIFGLAVSLPLGRSWNLRAAGTHASARNPQGLASLYTTDDFSLDLARKLFRRLDLVVGGRWRRRDAPQALRAPRWTLALAYSRTRP